MKRGIPSTLGVLATVSAIGLAGCSKKDDKDDPAPSTSSGGGIGGGGGGGGGGVGGENKIVVVGTLAVGALRLNGDNVTHVVARDVNGNEAAVAAVAADGSYELGLDRETPWLITYIDDTKSGPDMIVGTFASDTLDTLSPSATATDVDMGTVELADGKTVTTQTRDDFLGAIGMSAEAATTFGKIDDVCLRYSNPDIDGDGKLDATQGENGRPLSFDLDFHNRFNATKLDGTGYQLTDLVNAFYDAADVKFTYTGTGVYPWFRREVLGGVEPTAYSWTFSKDTKLGTNGGTVCTGYSPGDTLPAGTKCNMTYQPSQYADYFTPGLELALPEDGTYVLEASGKTMTWTNVKISDFSAGEGFIALFTRFDQSAGGKMTGVSHKWMKKGESGAYELATQEEIDLVIKRTDTNRCGYLSFKMDNGNNGEVGVVVGCQPEGSVVFADVIDGDKSDVVMLDTNSTTYRLSDVKAGLPTGAYLDAGNLGVSYDDKLGMRFFF